MSLREVENILEIRSKFTEHDLIEMDDRSFRTFGLQLSQAQLWALNLKIEDAGSTLSELQDLAQCIIHRKHFVAQRVGPTRSPDKDVEKVGMHTAGVLYHWCIHSAMAHLLEVDDEHKNLLQELVLQLNFKDPFLDIIVFGETDELDAKLGNWNPDGKKINMIQMLHNLDPRSISDDELTNRILHYLKKDHRRFYAGTDLLRNGPENSPFPLYAYQAALMAKRRGLDYTIFESSPFWPTNLMKLLD